MSAVEHEIESTRDTATALVAIASSAGGLHALIELMRDLPRELPAAVVLAQHMGSFSILPELMASRTPLATGFARDNELLRVGHFYICPPDRHLSIGPDARIGLSPRERIDFLRPSADWLFESAAAAFRENAVGVVLSGLRKDGAKGARRIRAAGGHVIVQDPVTASCSEMPLAAIQAGVADRVLAPAAIGGAIVEHVAGLDLQTSWRRWDRPFDPAQSTK